MPGAIHRQQTPNRLLKSRVVGANCTETTPTAAAGTNHCLTHADFAYGRQPPRVRGRLDSSAGAACGVAPDLHLRDRWRFGHVQVRRPPSCSTPTDVHGRGVHRRGVSSSPVVSHHFIRGWSAAAALWAKWGALSGRYAALGPAVPHRCGRHPLPVDGGQGSVHNVKRQHAIASEGEAQDP